MSIRSKRIALMRHCKPRGSYRSVFFFFVTPPVSQLAPSFLFVAWRACSCRKSKCFCRAVLQLTFTFFRGVSRIHFDWVVSLSFLCRGFLGEFRLSAHVANVGENLFLPIGRLCRYNITILILFGIIKI